MKPQFLITIDRPTGAHSVRKAGWRELFSLIRRWVTPGSTITIAISRIR